MPPWPAGRNQVICIFQACTAKTTTTQGSMTRECTSLISLKLHISDRSSQTLPAFPAKARKYARQKEKEKRQKNITQTPHRNTNNETSMTCARLSLAATSCHLLNRLLLAEWTWFNPCISCHGFPFSPPHKIMTWEEPACWVTATRKHAENRPAMLQATTTHCLSACACVWDNLFTFLPNVTAKGDSLPGPQSDTTNECKCWSVLMHFMNWLQHLLLSEGRQSERCWCVVYLSDIHYAPSCLHLHPEKTIHHFG